MELAGSSSGERTCSDTEQQLDKKAIVEALSVGQIQRVEPLQLLREHAGLCCEVRESVQSFFVGQSFEVLCGRFCCSAPSDE